MSARQDEFKAPIPPLRSRSYSNIVGLPLTDKRIDFYKERGWYSSEFREARRELQAMKQKRQAKRSGNFIEMIDGSLVFSPI